MSTETAVAWLTVNEAATHSRRNPETLYLALHAYVQSGGKRGLRGVQPSPRARWRIRPADLEAWMAGEQPARLGRAS